MNPRVLIADDEQTMGALLSNLLISQGCMIAGWARNGNEALQMFQELKPDIIFLDIDMPICNGIEALREIRKIDTSTYVCMISANSLIETVTEAIDLGINGFIVKPMTQKRVHEVIQNFLKERRKR